MNRKTAFSQLVPLIGLRIQYGGGERQRGAGTAYDGREASGNGRTGSRPPGDERVEEPGERGDGADTVTMPSRPCGTNTVCPWRMVSASG